MRRAAILAACLLATPVCAQDDVRPVARPGPASAVLTVTGDMPVVRPMARPTDIAPTDTGRPLAMRPVAGTGLSLGTMTRPEFKVQDALPVFSASAASRSLRPRARTEAIEAAAAARMAERLRGQVCGDPSIQGTTLGQVADAGTCGILAAVNVTSVAGVALSPKATMDCQTASALKTWVEGGVLPAVGSEGGGLSSLRVVSHYACRSRNNQAGARLSEHAFGRAIDIAGIRLRDGTEMTVLTDWNSEDHGARLRQMWRAACGPFKTVLGPEANRFHRDHFHFDTARNRNRAYCR